MKALRGNAMNERDIFLAAIEITDPARRAAYVEQACGSDAKLRAQVEELLKTHAQAGQFLETPAVAADSLVAQTLVMAASHADEDPHAERASGEAEFRKYLQPAMRPGWLGRLGHYEIEAILGRGAFGIVAKAFDEKLHRVVAIKLMNPELASTSPPRQRFLREARTAAAVTHENIVAIHAVEEEPIPYLVMEYISGQTLQQRMDARGPFEAKEILRIGQQVAAGLAAAHGANLIHRDIKPSNILLAGGPAERAKISDFGLARAVDDATMTSSGLIAGTPMYMAPEQARGETLDHRADLFSLGSVLYQMASGRPPFRAANTVAVLKRVCEDTPRPLNDVIPGIPGWLETIVFRLLEKDRDARYQTAQEVADLLARCQSELQHAGYVSCVNQESRTTETQEFQTGKPAARRTMSGSIGWLIGVVLAASAAIGIALLNGGKYSLDSGKTISHVTAPSPVLPNPSSAASSNVIGWHGWPADAPKSAIAPFDAEQARKHQEEWAAYLKVPVEWENSIGMKFRLIPPGEYLRGSSAEEIAGAMNARPDDGWKTVVQGEGPQHQVILIHPWYLSVFETTQENFQQVLDRSPSYYSPRGEGQAVVVGMNTSQFPVENISLLDAVEFCLKLSSRESFNAQYRLAGDEFMSVADGDGYRLPTEAEWEFACRAGTTTSFHAGDSSDELASIGWYASNSQGHPHPVGKLSANAYGLYDLHGNVIEWCEDGASNFAYQAYAHASVVNPRFPRSKGATCIFRGGDFRGDSAACRSSSRDNNFPQSRHPVQGFRVVLTVDAVRQAFKGIMP